MFLTTVSTTFHAILQISLISCVAAVLVKKNILSKPEIKGLANITVNLFLPCLIISTTISKFDPTSFEQWWILPLAGVLIIVAGLLFGIILFRLDPDKHSLLPLASMQNAIYIVLPIGRILYPDQFEYFALFCFLLSVGHTPVVWSIGKVLISGEKGTRIQGKDFITPPFIATFASIFIVLANLQLYIPSFFMDSMSILGQATIPLAIFILGATLGTINFKDFPSFSDTFIVALIKFFLVPLTVFAFLYNTNLYVSLPLISTLLIIQASSPPATNLILIVRNYGGDNQGISSMMLLQYLVCIFAMPFWLALWQWFIS